MNLREQIEKEITEKVMTKLASEKVELGLIDDFNKLSSKAINSGTDAGGDIQDWANKLPKLVSALKNSQKDQKAVIELGNKIKKQAKDLGIPLPNKIDKEIKGAEQWFKEIETIVKKAQSFKL